MSVATHAFTSRSSWTLDDVPYDQVDTDLVRGHEDLFYLVVGASFVEIAADLYTQNLINYFGDDPDVAAWLSEKWQHEEMRHGQVLRAYAQRAWPDFNWQMAYDAFFAEYSKMCTVDEFEPTQGLEMVARCVVETGTATFYTALARQATEPILAGIAQRIRADEVSHYKHFYQYFRKFQGQKHAGRWQIFQALKRRVIEARASDVDCALWHAYLVRIAPDEPDRREFKALCRRLGRQLKRHYPVEMAVKMVVKPLGLPVLVNRLILWPLSRASGWLLR